MELTTAVRYGLDPIVILLDNAGYGTERPMLDGPFNDVVPWRYERLPEILGAGQGYDVHTEADLDAALMAARRQPAGSPRQGQPVATRVRWTAEQHEVDCRRGSRGTPTSLG